MWYTANYLGNITEGPLGGNYLSTMTIEEDQEKGIYGHSSERLIYDQMYIGTDISCNIDVYFGGSDHKKNDTPTAKDNDDKENIRKFPSPRPSHLPTNTYINWGIYLFHST